jgi:ketosteroid isomerase-like protein
MLVRSIFAPPVTKATMTRAPADTATTVTKVGVTVAVAALLVVALNPSRTALPAKTDWEHAVKAVDEAYWAAYNRADAATMNAMLADDAEFYQDRTGALIGKEALARANETMQAGAHRLRRQVVAGTLQFSPLRKDEQVYGAVVSGEHQFFADGTGKDESQAARVHFTELMLLKGAQWKVARILSYEQGR